MKSTLVIRRLTGLALLALALSPAAGCSKMMANFSLNQANKRLEKAKGHQADKFAPDELNQTLQKVNAAQQQVNGGQFAEARQSAKEAAVLAKTLLEKTITQRANFLKMETNRWIGILDLNQGNSENAVLYQTIVAGNTEGSAAFDKQKWEASITAYDKAVNDSMLLLANLKIKAEQALKDVEGYKKQLEDEGANEVNPEAVTKVEDYRRRIDDFITVKYDYRTAISTKDQAYQDSQEGLRRTKEIKSDKILRSIEASLTRATQLGAELYATQTFSGVTRDFDELLKQHFEGKYDTVLTSGPKLKQSAEELIVETQRESARAKLKAVEKAIADLDNGKARVYLPGRLEKIEEIQKQAQELFGQQKYTETEEAALRGLEVEKSVVADFDAMAKAEIDAAKGKLTVTEGIFERMKEIFSEQVIEPISPDDRSFESHKTAYREELAGRVQAAKLQIGLTSLRVEEKQYAAAIETSKEVRSIADEIDQGVFRVVSHNNIHAISAELTRYEREGGRQYAPAELDKTEKMLLETRELHKNGDFRQALAHGAETHSQLEILAQELERQAVSKINDARKELTKARENRGEAYQEYKIIQVGQLLSEANDQLNQEGLRTAIETADRAKDIAVQAGDDSLKQWVEDEMRRTDLVLAKAQDAGAANYAAVVLNEAVNLRRQTQSLYDAGDYAEARVTGSHASTRAESALYALVLKAEDEIAAAKRIEAGDLEPERLAQAIINAKYAREFLDQGNYKKANLHAEHAYATAAEVVVAVKKATFNNRLVSLNQKVEEASGKGVAYYQIKDLTKIVGEMNALATEFSPDGYDEARDKIELLETQLAGLVEMTPGVVKELTGHLRSQLADYEDRGAKINWPEETAQAARKIEYAEMDFENQRYRPSFENAKDALRILNELGLRLAERDYDLVLSRHFSDLNRGFHKFGKVLDIGPPVLTRLAQGSDGSKRALAVMGASSPIEFRQSVNDIAARVSGLQPPSTRRDVQEAAVRMLEIAKEAASNFEKLLILDQYSPGDANKIIVAAYEDVRRAQGMQRDIQQALAHPQTKAEQAGVRRAIEVRNP